MRFLAIAALFITAPGTLIAREFRDNPTELIDRAVETEFLPIGELEAMNPELEAKTGMTVTRYGSGLLVSPCYVLTNAHVVFGEARQPMPGHTYQMKFHIGLGQDGTGFFGATKAVPVIWGNFRPNGGNDWALLNLATCVGAPKYNIGWFEGVSRAADDFIDVSIVTVGFRTSDRRGELGLSRGKVLRVDPATGMLEISSSLSNGQSGGGTFEYIEHTTRLIGLNAQSHTDGSHDGNETEPSYTSQFANEAINVAEILNRPDIKKLLDEDKARVGNDNRNLSRLQRPLFRMHQLSQVPQQ